VPVEARSSLIAGRGLFTTAAIAQGQHTVFVDDGAATVAELGLINHSCDPNMAWTNDRSLHAARDVAAGAELTVDYATAIDDPSFVMMCHCETYRCRQVIEGTDWQIPQLRQRYADWFAPAIQRRIDAASGDV
jgi:hypothetical protein